MAAELTYVKGLPELAAHLKTLPKQIAQRCLRRGVAAGASLIRAAAKTAAPISREPRRRGMYRVQPGTLKRSIVMKFARNESDVSQVKYIVTARKGRRFQKTGRDAYYASWVEYGHKIVPRSGRATTVLGVYRNRLSIGSRRRSSRGNVAPRPYLAPSADRLHVVAVERMRSRIEADLAKLDDFRP